MSHGREAERAHLDALMHRMLGGLLLLGAAVLLGLAVLLWRLPRVEGAGGAFLLLPGTQGHMVSILAVPVLGAAALLLGLPGALAIALARHQAPFRAALRTAVPRRSRRRSVLMLVGGLALLAVALLRHRF